MNSGIESVVCKHYETIESFHGYSLGTCKGCGQVLRYDHIDIKQPPVLVKIGRINGVPTLEHPPKEVIEVVQNKPEAASIAQKEPEVTKVNDEVKKTEEPVSQPEPVQGKRGYKRQQYFEDNKEAILDDYQDLTLKEFYEKYHIACLTWTQLKKKWGVKGKHDYKRNSPPDTNTPEAHKGSPMVSLGTFRVEAAGELPDFPEFNDTWPMLTQIAWLETYRALKELE